MMRQLYIPSVGDRIRLTADWEFDLYCEYRNSTLVEVLGLLTGGGGRNLDVIKASIPSGEVLKIDRIYIRKGSGDFDSITFMWEGMSTQPRIEDLGPGWGKRIVKVPRKPVRFWVKLPCANKIEFEPV
jgi:hypothetical protein